MQLECDPLGQSKEARQAALRAIDQLPLRVLKHYGDFDPQKLYDAISYARRRLNCRYFVVDHLGFLVSEEDERKQIDRIIRHLAKMAVQLGMTIALIVHPSNIAAMQKRRVKLSDAKGSSAIRQDAHDGIVIESLPPTKNRRWPAAKFYFDKIRSEYGRNGSSCMLAFDPLSCQYADTWDETPAARRAAAHRAA